MIKQADKSPPGAKIQHTTKQDVNELGGAGRLGLLRRVMDIEQHLMAKVCHDLASPTTAMSLAVDTLMEFFDDDSSVASDVVGHAKIVAKMGKENLDRLTDRLVLVRGLFGSRRDKSRQDASSLKDTHQERGRDTFLHQRPSHPTEPYWHILKKMAETAGLRLVLEGSLCQPSIELEKNISDPLEHDLDAIKRIAGSWVYHCLAHVKPTAGPNQATCGGTSEIVLTFQGMSVTLCWQNSGAPFGHEKDGNADFSVFVPPENFLEIVTNPSAVPEPLSPANSVLWHTWLLAFVRGFHLEKQTSGVGLYAKPNPAEAREGADESKRCVC